MRTAANEEIRKIRKDLQKKSADPSNVDSINKLYLETIQNKFPQIGGQKLQTNMERQTLGLVSFPRMTGRPEIRLCPMCNKKCSVIHVALKCPQLEDLRRAMAEDLRILVDKIAVTPNRWNSASTQAEKMLISYVPHKV